MPIEWYYKDRILEFRTDWRENHQHYHHPLTKLPTKNQTQFQPSMFMGIWKKENKYSGELLFLLFRFQMLVFYFSYTSLHKIGWGKMESEKGGNNYWQLKKLKWFIFGWIELKDFNNIDQPMENASICVDNKIYIR